MLRRVKGFIYATPTLERDPPHTYKLVLVAKGTVAGAKETTTESWSASPRYWRRTVHDVRAYTVHISTGTVLVPVLVAPLSSSRA
jgi:hypothetical protein